MTALSRTMSGGGHDRRPRSDVQRRKGGPLATLLVLLGCLCLAGQLGAGCRVPAGSGHQRGLIRQSQPPHATRGRHQPGGGERGRGSNSAEQQQTSEPPSRSWPADDPWAVSFQIRAAAVPSWVAFSLVFLACGLLALLPDGRFIAAAWDGAMPGVDRAQTRPVCLWNTRWQEGQRR